MNAYCTWHEHATPARAYACKMRWRKSRIGRWRRVEVDGLLAVAASAPVPHVVLHHDRPRSAKVGAIELLVWSEATVLMYY